MERVLKKLMVLIVAIASSVAALAQTAQVGNVYYLFNSEDKTATVVANRNEMGSILPNSYRGDVTIPSTVVYGGQTYNVTAIGEKAFLACAITTTHPSLRAFSAAVQCLLHHYRCFCSEMQKC